ncbi:2-amino-4-hydroxy-6-hydroxymethyldihydropteridine diphosphokinase [Leptospira idonii]|uniref:2-amino-4-hydroxy-6-hydroxymethyldihydropteridine pyrophosphokinase n=1 Tax=Leptospira idonii TaxID=1193500 RepID=A0A4R9M4Z7_9LEPT|nr:2-amino-4-hydroxy-6-hydroxymethyldihydropteridine diphosphokinase [Leptospira idonii]TGN20895.1 2-amino-4-hydroxy-6-hydroxymethyldihydropteridine diphosphokinase [Leptospira idonii]
MKYSNTAYLSLGSNMGDRHHYLEQAVWEISLLPEIQVLSQSKPLETAPLENTNQPMFLNQIIKVHVSPSFTLPCLLESLQSIENKLGRKRRSWKGPREIDIDILSYESVVMTTDFLTLPHHSLFTRPFIKQILVEMGEVGVYSLYQESVYEKYHSRV